MSKSVGETWPGVQRAAGGGHAVEHLGVVQVGVGHGSRIDPLDDENVVIGGVLDDGRTDADLGRNAGIVRLRIPVDPQQSALRACEARDVLAARCRRDLVVPVA